MKFADLFKRQASDDDAYSALESNLSEMLMVEFVPPQEPDHGAFADHDDAPVEAIHTEADEVADADEPVVEAGPRTTGYTQARLAEFAAFETLHTAAGVDLDMLRSTLGRINAAHHQTNEFLSSIHSSIHRTNELEIANARLATQNRGLYRQAEQVKRLRAQQESLVESFKRREERLVDAANALRASLSSLKLEMVDARALTETMETERQEALNSLASASTQLDMTARENDMLREKQINLAADLETSLRRRTEAERKVDELAAVHQRDSAEIADLRAKLGMTDAERQKLQKQSDAVQARLAEAGETIAALEQEMEEVARRNDVGVQNAKAERDTLVARLEVAAKAEIESAERIGHLTMKLNDALDLRRIAEDRLASAVRDIERAHAPRNEPDVQSDQIAELRGEVDRLMTIVKKLTPYERLYKAAKEREADKTAMPGNNAMPAQPLAGIKMAS